MTKKVKRVAKNKVVAEIVSKEEMMFYVVGREPDGYLCGRGVLDALHPWFYLPWKWESMRVSLNTRPGPQRQRVVVRKATVERWAVDICRDDILLVFDGGRYVNCYVLGDALRPLLGKTLYLEVEYE